MNRVELGGFNRISASIYENCRRVWLSEPSEDGKFSACIVDGVLYISQKKEDGKYVIVSANSVFDLEISN